MMNMIESNLRKERIKKKYAGKAISLTNVDHDEVGIKTPNKTPSRFEMSRNTEPLTNPPSQIHGNLIINDSYDFKNSYVYRKALNEGKQSTDNNLPSEMIEYS